MYAIGKQVKIVKRENGMFGVQRIASGCVFGNFETEAEAFVAICEAGLADSYRPEATA